MGRFAGEGEDALATAGKMPALLFHCRILLNELAQALYVIDGRFGKNSVP
jgi:hypothetical protein